MLVGISSVAKIEKNTKTLIADDIIKKSTLMIIKACLINFYIH